MITVDNRSKHSTANHKEHRRLAMLFFAQRRTDGAIHTDDEKKTQKEVRICYSSRTGIC